MKKNDGRDNELDRLLKPLQAAAPNDLQMQRWKSAIQANNRKSGNVYSTSRTKWVIQLIAAMFVGIVIGGMVFKSNNSATQQSPIVAQISLDDATFERSHDNLD